MGAGASAMTVTASMDKETFQKVAPDHFSVSLFNSLKDRDATIPPARLMQFFAAATDCFLTHDWGRDELDRDNHSRVGKLNALLKAKGFRTWFDEEMMRGDIQQQMSDGIDHASCVIVFITERYMDKVAGKGEKGQLDNCLFEFSHLSLSKDRNKIFPVVMEPRCRDTATWFGKVKFVLGSQLYTDYCSDENIEAVADDLANKMRQVLSDGLTANERIASLAQSQQPQQNSIDDNDDAAQESASVEHKTLSPSDSRPLGLKPAEIAAPAMPASTPTIDVLVPHILLQREIRSIDELIVFFKKECKILPKFAEQYAHGMVRSRGIYNVDMLASRVKSDGGSKEDLGLLVGNAAHVKSIMSVVAARPISQSDSQNIVFEEDEDALLRGLAERLGFTGDDKDAVLDLYGLYTSMVSAGHMLSCIAICFCELIASSFGVVQVDQVNDAIVGGESCFNIEDAKSQLAISGSLTEAAISTAWEVFAQNVLSLHHKASELAEQKASSKPELINNDISPFPAEKESDEVKALPPSGGYVFTNDMDLRDMVDMWCDESTRDKAEARCGHISSWDTSKITSMKSLFFQKETFNDDISQWDVSRVKDMSFMFAGAYSFNQPIGNWNVGKVTNMSSMFRTARAFNQPIGKWDVSKVTNMECMFCSASAFNQQIGEWNVSRVVNMEKMFMNAGRFSEPIFQWNINPRCARKMGDMFEGAYYRHKRPSAK